MTPETVKPLLVKAQMHAKSLAAETGYLTSDTADFVLLSSLCKSSDRSKQGKRKRLQRTIVFFLPPRNDREKRP